MFVDWETRFELFACSWYNIITVLTINDDITYFIIILTFSQSFTFLHFIAFFMKAKSVHRIFEIDKIIFDKSSKSNSMFTESCFHFGNLFRYDISGQRDFHWMFCVFYNEEQRPFQISKIPAFCWLRYRVLRKCWYIVIDDDPKYFIYT